MINAFQTLHFLGRLILLLSFGSEFGVMWYAAKATEFFSPPP